MAVPNLLFAVSRPVRYDPDMKRSTVWIPGLGAVAATYVGFVVIGHLVNRQVTTEDLVDPETRLRAYHRLWMQTEEAHRHDFYKPLHSFSTFHRQHRSIRLQKIPVPGDPDHPLYLTLRDSNMGTGHLKTPWSSWERGREWSSWTAWFFPPPHLVAAPPLEEPGPEPVKRRYVISLLTHEGRLLDEENPRPFVGANLTEAGDVIHDINRDGWVERVHSNNVGFKDVKDSAELLKITRIDRETEEIFNVVINVGRDASLIRWGFACRDVDGDGTLEIEIGPTNGAGISPEVTFFWSPASGTYESPSGKAGSHFLVVPPESLWETLEKLASANKLSYPLDR